MKTTLIVILFVVGTGYVFRDDIIRYIYRPTRVDTVEDTLSTAATDTDEVQQPLFEVVVENLEIPWDIGFLPNGDMVVTERPGRLVRIDGEGKKHSIPVSAVKHAGEGGLLGLALHPDFEENGWLYVYITSDVNADGVRGTVNRVERYRYENDELLDRFIVIDDIPGSLFHNGGQIEFGPDGYLYITTGDARDPDSAQDRGSLAGKILRVTDGGNPAPDNQLLNYRYAAYVYSYGHRNPQGLAWDDEGRLWSTEHGRSGLLSGLDELSQIELGGNYGWPDSQGDIVLENTIGPEFHSGPDITWAPASLAYLNGRLYWGGLRGESLYEYEISTGEFRQHFFQEFGRIRAVVVGLDGMLYVSTSNRDGRGEMRDGDDKIIRVNPRLLR